MDRRKMLKLTTGAIAGSAIMGTDAFAADIPDKEKQVGKTKKALVIGAHPDDPETGCGGTMLSLKDAGYDVVAVYMTKGEGGISGKSGDEAAAIRVPEAERACAMMGVRPVFMDQIDGNTEINKMRYAQMRELIAAENPDIVFTHWPIDSHPDHRVCSLLVYDAWRRLDYSFELYYYEVMSGLQSQLFQPTDWVDITKYANLKRKASLCHVSQGIEEIYDQWHNRMELFRGLEFRCGRAEAFIHLRRESNDIQL